MAFRIMIIGFPYFGGSSTEADTSFQDAMINVLKELCDSILWLGGSVPQYSDKKIKVVNLRGRKSKGGLLYKGGHQFLTDLKLCFYLVRFRREFDVAFYYLAKGYILSMIVARLLGKRVALWSANSVRKLIKVLPPGSSPNVPGWLHYNLMLLTETLSFRLTHRIWVESESVIRFSEIDQYRGKISVPGVPPLDCESFSIIKQWEERGNRIGYLGRLGEMKGLRGLIQAFPKILGKVDAELLIAGKGELLEEIEKEANKCSKIRLLGWVPKQELPSYLNEVKLLVVPSYSESGCTVVREAMACGTVVVSTAVGMIPDLIKDGQTGFIMENNTPACIARNVVRALNHPDLSQIAQNGRRLVEQRFSFQASVERWRRALDEVIK